MMDEKRLKAKSEGDRGAILVVAACEPQA